jgi:cell division control protein 6
MNQTDLQKILGDVQARENIFVDKSFLDGNITPSNIIGRHQETQELVRYIIGYKKNFIVPLISIYGRAGSGKSTLVKFVCDNLKDELSFCFVNLRKSRTIFGAVNLILGELGVPSVKSSHGINTAIDTMEKAIQHKLADEQKKLYLLVLDEFDVLFLDKRNKPSDFVYKLLMLQENLKKQGSLLCIIAISNNVIADYELDDRIRSRVGTSEIAFQPYSKEDILEILKSRSESALAPGSFDDTVLEYCATQSSLGHGDARRAIDLLRVAAETAAYENQQVILPAHINAASSKLQKDRLDSVLRPASYHVKLACFSIARLSYLTDKPEQSTSEIYAQYKKLVSSNIEPLSHRRVSEILKDLENTGIILSQTSSRGRYGYGTRFRFAYDPDIVGNLCYPAVWKEIKEKKDEYEEFEKELLLHGTVMFDGILMKYDKKASRALRTLVDQKKTDWLKYVGVE